MAGSVGILASVLTPGSPAQDKLVQGMTPCAEKRARTPFSAHESRTMEQARRAGAASVSMVELNPARLETAKELGCTHTVTSADDLEQERGWDDVVDCTGVVAAIEDGLGRVLRGGTFQQFGVANEDAVARFSPFRVYSQEIMISDRRPLEEYPAALEQFRAGVGRKIQVCPQSK